MVKKVKPLPTPIQKGPLEAKELGAFVRARRTQAGMGRKVRFRDFSTPETRNV